jgi:O-antigen/teichoic acid export membrane protein
MGAAMRALLKMAGGNLVGPVSAIVVSPILARSLGVDGRGVYAALTMPILMLGIVGTFGVQDGLAYAIAQRGLGTRRAFRYMWETLPLASAATMVAAGGIGFLLFRHQSGGVLRSFLILTLSLPLQIAYNMAIGIATGSADVTAVNGARVAPNLVRALVVVTLCLSVTVSALTAAAVLLLSASVGLAWIAVRCRAKERHDAGSEPTFTRAAVVKFSVTAFPGVLASVSTARLDQIIGLPLIGARQLGLYAVAVSLAELPMVFGTAARSAILGMPARTVTGAEGQQLIRRVTGAVAVGAAVMGIVTWRLAPIVFGRPFAGVVLPAIILLAATVVYTVGSCLSAALLALGNASSQSRALLVGASASVLSLIGLRSFGAVGASIASALGYGVTAAMCFASLRRDQGFSFRSAILPARADIRWGVQNVVRVANLARTYGDVRRQRLADAGVLPR